MKLEIGDHLKTHNGIDWLEREMLLYNSIYASVAATKRWMGTGKNTEKIYT